MRVHLVTAHPEPKSFCAAMARRATEALEAGGHAVEVSDLYAMRWNPVASAADFGERRDPGYLTYALEQRHGWETGSIAPDVRGELERLLRADLLLLVFPLFWFSVPAIMKGWIDRVLVSGATYGGRRFYDRGPLKGKRAAVALTLGGREHMFGPGAVHGPLDDMLRPLLRGTLHYTGMDVLPPFVAWHVPYVDDAARRGYLERLDGWIGELERSEPLRFPGLDGFNERMRPR
jgi:NAD(P)H dehydrogenase (quinone)